MIEVKFSLELTKNGVQKCVHAKSGEENSRKAVITLTENGKVFDAAGYYVKVYFDNGKHVDTEDGRKLVTVENGCIGFVIPYDLVAEEGERLCEVQISKDNRILYSPVFKVLVEQSLGQHGVSEPVGDVTRYQEVIPDLMLKESVAVDDEIAVYTPEDELTTKRKVSSLPFGKKFENEAQIERINASDVDEIKQLSNGKYVKTEDVPTSVLDKLTLGENGELLFDGQPINSETIDPSALPALVVTDLMNNVLLKDWGMFYSSIESAATASNPESLFRVLLENNITSPPAYGGNIVLYSPPKSGELTYTNPMTYEENTIEVKAGYIYSFYVMENPDSGTWELAVLPAYGTGIRDILLTGYVTENNVDSKIQQTFEEGDFVTNEQLNEKLLSISGYAKLSDIPTKTSQLTNDSGFITAEDLPESDFSQFVEKLADGVNQYEPQTEGWTDDGYIVSSGEVKVNTTSYKSYAVTPAIPIKGGTTYTVKPIFNTVTSIADKSKARTYDSTGAALSEMVLTVNEDSVTFTTPENSETIRFTVQAKVFGGREVVDANDIETVINTFNSSFMLVEGTEAPEEYEPFGNSGYKLKDIALPDKSVNLESVSDEALPIFASLAGKKIANFGDSIFGNARPPKDVSTFLAEKTGAEVLNCAFGGCRMGVHTGHWDAFSMYRLAYAIANNDYSLQDDALNYDDRVSYAETPLALIKSTDFSTVDILTIGYGTNDFTGGNALDNEENSLDTSTLAGALRYSIETLLTAYPNLRIFIVSATYRFWKDENNEFIEDSKTYLNKHNKTLPEYNAKLKEVAEEYNLPFIDNYNIGIGKFNRYQHFPVTDGTHHNETGRKLIASHLAKELY